MTNINAVEKMAELMQQIEENSPRVAALQYSLKLVGEKMEEGEKRIAELEAKCAALAAENAGLKSAAKETLAHWAAAEPGEMEKMMDKCMPALRVAYCETPATDAFLAEVRAQGIKIAINKLVALAPRLDKRAVETLSMAVEHLRKGVQS